MRTARDRISQALIVLLVLLLGIAAIFPAAAQDDETEDCELVTVTGELEFAENGDLVVAEYVIAPAAAFIPATLSEGDTVTVVGCLLPDGVTVQALSLEIVEEDEVEEPEEPEAEEPEAEETPEATETPEEESDDTERGVFCANPDLTHPAGAKLAAEFDAEYEDIMAAFCEGGYGFGEIMIAYRLAKATGEDPQTYLDARGEGKGWGQIMQESGVHPAEVMAGKVLGSPPWADGDHPGGGPPADRPGGGPPADRPGGGPPADRPGGGPPGGGPPGRP